MAYGFVCLVGWLVSFLFHFILIPCYARHCLDPWIAYSWVRALLCSCLVISIFTVGHIHYVSRVLALLLYKHSDAAIRDCFQMRKLSLRQTKSLFFFQDHIAINVVEPNQRARGTVRPEKQKGLCLEWRKFYCRAMQEKGEAPALQTWTLWWFSGKTFHRQNWQGDCRVCNSPLICWRLCSGNLNDQPSGSSQVGPCSVSSGQCIRET